MILGSGQLGSEDAQLASAPFTAGPPPPPVTGQSPRATRLRYRYRVNDVIRLIFAMALWRW